ncbi:DUF711 family protein [Thermocladium modestius]|nr:DUF711 family protein [Thermocladium modestius]
MKIRAVTLFHDNVSDLDEMLNRLDLAINEASKETGLEVLTRRVTFPYMGPRLNVEEIGRIAERRGYVYSALAARDSVNAASLAKLLITTKSYGSVLVDDVGKAETVVEVLRIISQDGSDAAKRFAALIGGELETPYYPASVNLRGGTGIALAVLYPKDLIGVTNIEDLRAKLSSLRSAEEFGRRVADLAGIEYRGIDASLSPWGWESVVDVLEQLGRKLSSPGFMMSIWRVNKELMELPIKKLGFNEVMLPLAEDERLKERARSGELSFKDLTMYSSVCVAGVDMVPIPVSDVFKVRGVIEDLYSISRSKGRPIGLRLIPVKGSREVEVEGFGSTPVLSIY